MSSTASFHSDFQRRSSVGRSAPLLAMTLVAASLGCGNEDGLPTVPASEAALVTTTTAALEFTQLTAGTGNGQTCGVTVDNLLYCWGYNGTGSVGDGTTTRRLRIFKVSLTQLQEIAGVVDSHRLDRELDHLRALGLVDGGFNADEFEAYLTPTALALHMFARGQGHRGDPVDYFQANFSGTLFKDGEAEVPSNSTPVA